ncbi:MAG: DoxX family membrane protein [Phycisphaerales bacterium]|nr:DoxX family membrane protein [Phycisphaerales bacterium]
MSLRDRLTLTVPPLLIRLTLAITFIWAGYVKLMPADVSGQQAAMLANLGVQKVIDAAVIGTVPSIDEQPAIPDVVDTDEQPELPDPGLIVDEPEPDEAPPGEVEEPAADAVDEPPVETPEETPAEIPAEVPEDTPAEEPVEEPAETPEPDDDSAALPTTAAYHVTLVQGAAATVYTADQFPNAVEVKRLYLDFAILLDKQGWQKPIFLAWFATLTYVIGGLLLIPGIFSRVWALGLAIAMVVALWVTSIQPNLGTPGAFLGFWPPLRAVPDSQEWWNAVTAFWQLARCAMALAIVIGGPGCISLDGFLFGGHRHKREGDG